VILRTLRTNSPAPFISTSIHGAVLQPLAPTLAFSDAKTLVAPSSQARTSRHLRCPESYERIVANDVIVVENGVPDSPTLAI
jgi:hypothetical protein